MAEYKTIQRILIHEVKMHASYSTASQRPCTLFFCTFLSNISSSRSEGVCCRNINSAVLVTICGGICNSNSWEGRRKGGRSVRECLSCGKSAKTTYIGLLEHKGEAILGILECRV